MIHKKYNNLDELLKANLPAKEASNAKSLFEEINKNKEKKFLNKEEFLKICMWKSPRPKKYYLMNSEESIIKITRELFLTESELIKIERLTILKGVSIAVASAILTAIDQEKYGIIDIRAWQTLHTYGEVTNKPKGKGFDIEDWMIYLKILREKAIKFNTTPRQIEICLFFHHKKIGSGNLYD